MKLWLLTQSECSGYDTYDSAVVAAETNEQARDVNPSEYGAALIDWPKGNGPGGWATSREYVTAEYIGEAKPGTEVGVICASFNAG